MKKILIINGHPKKDSFSSALVSNYKKGAAESGAEIKEIIVTDMPIENYLRYDHFSGKDVGQDIKDARESITWAEHLVFVHPVWWGSMPAILKCFIDMVFSAGFAFKYKQGSGLPEKLLKGKTAHIITTMDTPYFIYNYFFGSPSINQLKNRTLNFCGISPVKVSHFGPVQSSTEEKRKKFLEEVYKLGKNLS
ncbi:MAG: NAD(P)H-dependent oxidoreductase [Candidatus Nomurabacteria bacterium]|nr:NAD(P)H-dependent oxidoreductase [Candidatus Nomurabacteria bacterium]